MIFCKLPIIQWCSPCSSRFLGNQDHTSPHTVQMTKCLLYLHFPSWCNKLITDDKQLIFWVISGFHCDVAENCTLLGYYAVSSGSGNYNYSLCNNLEESSCQLIVWSTTISTLAEDKTISYYSPSGHAHNLVLLVWFKKASILFLVI
jgi:hypothetical protein